MSLNEVGNTANWLVTTLSDFFNMWKLEILTVFAVVGIIWWVITTGLNTKLDKYLK